MHNKIRPAPKVNLRGCKRDCETIFLGLSTRLAYRGNVGSAHIGRDERSVTSLQNVGDYVRNEPIFPTEICIELSTLKIVRSCFNGYTWFARRLHTCPWREISAFEEAPGMKGVRKTTSQPNAHLSKGFSAIIFNFQSILQLFLLIVPDNILSCHPPYTVVLFEDFQIRRSLGGGITLTFNFYLSLCWLHSSTVHS